MPLTDELKHAGSPIYQFIHGRFPNTDPVLRDTKEELAATTTIRPPGSVHYSTVGTALDYRLRYYFGITPPEKLVATAGAARITRTGLSLRGGAYIPPLFGYGALPKESEPVGELAPEFFESLQPALDELQPVGRRLEVSRESRLARYCYVLALFEALYRNWLGIRSPLFVPSPPGSIEELLATPPPAAVDDLCALSWAFYDDFSDLISRTQSIVLNPEFDGSRDVGGADADLILDGCLLEFKTSVRPKLDPFALYQLLGYVLLDYIDRHRIRSMGVYMARQRALLRWPLAELMGVMAGAPAPDLADVRAQFRQVAEGVRASRSAGRVHAAPEAPLVAGDRLVRETPSSDEVTIAISRPDLSAYLDIIDTVWEQGFVGADLTLKECESQRTEKHRLFMAAKQRGLRLTWRKAQPGQLRFVLAAAVEPPRGDRNRRES